MDNTELDLSIGESDLNTVREQPGHSGLLSEL